MSPTDYRVFVCDLETFWMRRPWPTGGCRAKNKHKSGQKKWLFQFGFSVMHIGARQVKHSQIIQGCTNPRHQVSRVTKFCAVAPQICRSWVCSLLNVASFGAEIILRWLPYFLENLCTPCIIYDLFNPDIFPARYIRELSYWILCYIKCGIETSCL